MEASRKNVIEEKCDSYRQLCLQPMHWDEIRLKTGQILRIQSLHCVCSQIYQISTIEWILLEYNTRVTNVVKRHNIYQKWTKVVLTYPVCKQISPVSVPEESKLEFFLTSSKYSEMGKFFNDTVNTWTSDDDTLWMRPSSIMELLIFL